MFGWNLIESNKFDLKLFLVAHRSSSSSNQASRLSFEKRRFPFTRMIGIGFSMRALPRAFDMLYICVEVIFKYSAASLTVRRVI
jgi:hypothetical protein